jgi:hypothetical protein
MDEQMKFTTFAGLALVSWVMWMLMIGGAIYWWRVVFR